MELSYSTIPILFVFIPYSIILASPVHLKVKRANICDNVECTPGYQCCEGGRDACGGNECEPCIDGTFSSGEVGEYCENCHNCLHGEDKIKDCTREKDTVCDCPYGKYITNYGVCKPCNICEGEDCKKCSVTTTTPKSTTKKTIVVPGKTNASTITVKTTASTNQVTNPQTENSSWRHVYLVPIICSQLFVVVVIYICCCWTDSNKFRKHCYIFCGKKSFDANEDADMANTVQGNDKSKITLVNLQTGDNARVHIGEKFKSAIEDTEQECLVNLNDRLMKQRNENSVSAVTKKRFTRQRFSSSSLTDVPEDHPLTSGNWCYQDRTRVDLEHISEISRHIGKEVVRIGLTLGLTKGEVETIEHNYKSDLSRQNLEVLQQWMEKRGVCATKGVLARALNSIGRPELALNHLWTDPEWKQGMSINKLTFWRRRKSQDLNSIFNNGYFRSKDWTKQSTWQEILDIMLENDYGSFRQLKLACGTVELHQPPLDSIQKCQYFMSSTHDLDQNAECLMDSQFKHLKPVCVPNGVNCLFSAASVIYYGSEDHFLELKLRSVIELTYHKDYYLRQKTLNSFLKAEYALTKVEKNADTLFKVKDVEAYFESLVKKTLIKQNLFSLQGNSIHLFGLASVLKCNIQSVYPTMGASEPSPLNVLITPRKEQDNPATVFIMWSRHTPIPEGEQFVSNHFVPLLQTNN